MLRAWRRKDPTPPFRGISPSGRELHRPTMSTAKPIQTRYVDVDSVWVRLNFGVACSVVLMLKDGSTSELRGAQMYAWLNEWSRQYRSTRKHLFSSLSSPVSGNHESRGKTWPRPAA